MMHSESLRTTDGRIAIHSTKTRETNMVNIRQATVHDLLQMQTTNLWCLPENYQVSKMTFL